MHLRLIETRKLIGGGHTRLRTANVLCTLSLLCQQPFLCFLNFCNMMQFTRSSTALCLSWTEWNSIQFQSHFPWLILVYCKEEKATTFSFMENASASSASLVHLMIGLYSLKTTSTYYWTVQFENIMRKRRFLEIAAMAAFWWFCQCKGSVVESELKLQIWYWCKKTIILLETCCG